MRVGKKPNIVEAKSTRSCVVRLENVSSQLPSALSTRPNKSAVSASEIKRSKRSSGGLDTDKEVAAASPQHNFKVMQKRSNNRRIASVDRTPQPPTRSTPTATMTNVRSNQKLKITPKVSKSAIQSQREDTPPPTIAAGRSRRAIKPNPKYASDDLITPKIIKNVASLASAGGTAKKLLPSNPKQRKVSSSSDDFYNQNSDNDFENNSNDDADIGNRDDKMYEIDDKDDQDSDFTDGEEIAPQKAKIGRGKVRKNMEFAPHINNSMQRKSSLQDTSRAVIKKSLNTPVTQTSVRAAPTQLQQLRRSLYAANAQRNINMLAGSGAGSSGIGHKRKLEESEKDTNAPVRKQLIIATPTGSRLRGVPVKTPSTTGPAATRLASKVPAAVTSGSTSEQTINGNKIVKPAATISNLISDRRRLLDASKTVPTSSMKIQNRPVNIKPNQTNKNIVTKSFTGTSSSTVGGSSISQQLQAHAKLLTSKTQELNTRLRRTGSPKPDAQMKSQTAIATSSSLQQHHKQIQQKKNSVSTPTTTVTSRKSFIQPNHSTPAASGKSQSPSFYAAPKAMTLATATAEKPTDTQAINDPSPNSTIDDFETMPTFTIVNVNDIINKKGDVLITKSTKTATKKPSFEFAESISLDDEDDDDDDGAAAAAAAAVADDDVDDNDDDEPSSPPPTNVQKTKKSKVSTSQNNSNNSYNDTSNAKDLGKKSSPLARSSISEKFNKDSNQKKSSPSSTLKNSPPEILNHKLGLRNSERVKAKTTTPVDKPAPRILNSVVAKKTQPVKPLIANPDDSADESFPLSLDEDESEDEENEFNNKLRKIQNKKHKKNTSIESMMDTDETESQQTELEDDTPVLSTAATAAVTNATALTPKNSTVSPTTQRKKRTNNVPLISPKKRLLTPSVVAKENSLSLAASQNRENSSAKSSAQQLQTTKKLNNEKVVVSRQGDKIIKKITCFETWYVINMPPVTDQKSRFALAKNELEMPLIKLANLAKTVSLPSELWTCKVTLYEVSASTLSKNTLATYTGDLSEHNIREEDRGKYQPSCVMFRRSVTNRKDARMPYDRAVLFKNKTFYTNIEGKNVRLSGSPTAIATVKDIEILLEIVDSLTLQSDFVEQSTTVQH